LSFWRNLWRGTVFDHKERRTKALYVNEV
jgi:uncharacterized protein YjlB